MSLLAKYAKGSMRDGLSLTDQAIAQSGQNIQLTLVQQMLGTVDVSWGQNIFSAILQSDGEKLVAELQRLALQNPDLEKVLDDLLTLCHQVAMTQVLPSAAKLNERSAEFIQAVANQVPAQQVQVYYQMLLQGKKDIRLAADMMSGFEMVCLRLLAFNPVNQTDEQPQVKKNSEIKLPEPSIAETPVAKAEPKQELQPQQQAQPEPLQQQAPQELEPNEPVEQETATEPQQPAEEPQLQEQHLPEPQQNSAPVDEFDAQQQQASDELAAQEAFYHELAQSQGFQGEEVAPQAQYEAEPQQVPEPQPNPDTQMSASAEVQQQDFSAIDNPVLAILASREAESSAVEQAEQERQQQAQASAPAPEEVIEAEPEVEVEPELKPLEHEEVRFAHEVDRWASLIERSGLMGLTRQLALQSAPDINGNHIELTVKKDYAHLLNDKTEAELYDVVSRMAPDCEFVINKSEIAEYSPAAIQQNINENRQDRAEQSIQQDPFVQTLLNEFDAKLIPDSIKPL